MISPNRLNDKHYTESIVNRGLNSDWVQANAASVDHIEASRKLGYYARSAGIWLEGVNGQGQFRPDKPWKNNPSAKGKPPKYRTATGTSYDIVLPRHPGNPKYWDEIDKYCYQVRGKPCILLTEGIFKAIASCQIGIPAIALLGVEMGLTGTKRSEDGQRFLVKSLKKIVDKGIGIIHAFDADFLQNPHVIAAQWRLVKAIEKYSPNTPQYLLTGAWDIDESGKGIDDVILYMGEDYFKNLLPDALEYKLWGKIYEDYLNPKRKLTSGAACIEILKTDFHKEWKYLLNRKHWIRWNGKYFEYKSREHAQKRVMEIFEKMNILYSTFRFVQETEKLLALKLGTDEEPEEHEKRIIPFDDGVWDVEANVMELKPHDPSNNNSYCLPFKAPKINLFSEDEQILEQLRRRAPNFYEWAMYSQSGDGEKVLKLLAIVASVIKGDLAKWQMFVQLKGVPGAGKSTFSNILEKIIGRKGHTSANLSRLGDENLMAAILGSRLVTFVDENKFKGDFSHLRRLTGGDTISYRRIYEKPGQQKFYGSIVVVSNHNPFVGNNAGLKRRVCLVNFDKPIRAKSHQAEQRIYAEIPELIGISLSIKPEKTQNLIKGTGGYNKNELESQTWLYLSENDSLSMFLEERISMNWESEMSLGKKGQADSIYDMYFKFCEEMGIQVEYNVNEFRLNLKRIFSEFGLPISEFKIFMRCKFKGIMPRTEESLAISEELLVGKKPVQKEKEPIWQEIYKIWDDLTKLGKFILEMPIETLESISKNISPEQVKHIKAACKATWSPGLGRDVNYYGERAEIQEINTRHVVIKLQDSFISVSRNVLFPWLGCFII